MMRMPSRLLGLTTLGLALAACGQHVPPSVGGDTVTLTLRSPLGLTAQGLPSDASGLSTVRHLAVKITDANGNLVAFDGNNVYRMGGSQTTITLTPATPTATVVLPRGSYRFESVGKSAEDGTFLAWGKTASRDLTSSASASVALELNALADPNAVTLSDPLGRTLYASGDPVTLKLDVRNVQGTPVPTGDYGVAYSSTSGTVRGSTLGTVLTPTAGSQTNVTVNASVEAWVPSQSVPDTAERTTFIKSVTLPVVNVLRSGSGRYEEDAADIRYGAGWGRYAYAPASGGFDTNNAGTPGAELDFHFVGERVTLYGNKLPHGGQFDVYLDGQYVERADMYNPTEAPRSMFFTRAGLDPKVVHTVRLVAAATRNPSSSGTLTVFDYVEIR